MKGFISIGKNSTLNLDCVVVERCYFNKKINKAIIVDKYGMQYAIDKKLLKGKLEH